MPESKERPISSLRRILEAADSHVGNAPIIPSSPAISLSAYIPKRRVGAAAGTPRALTLQAGFIPPCLPMTAPALPSGPLWLHEIKHKGFRIIARNDGRRVKLYSRLGHDLSQRYPLICEAMARLPSCTIDGEAIACDESGTESFDLLQRRQRDDRVFLCAFDLIELAGEDRRRDALAQRKIDLRRLLAESGPGVQANEWIDGDESDGPSVFEHACSLGLEGIVSKRKDSRYISGLSPYWLKMNNPAKPATHKFAVSASPDSGAKADTSRGPGRAARRH
jgi:bifunctional non-homologous end joining protein LigD